MGYFPADEETCLYLKATGRTDEQIDAVRNYFKAQGMFGIPRQGECDYSTVLELDLGTIVPSVAGPKRPQDRIALPELERKFRELLEKDVKSGGYGKALSEIDHRFKTTLDTCDGEGRVGGGLQKSETAPMVALAAAALNTSAWSETEMMNNRPTPDRVEPSEPAPEVEVELGHGDVLIAAITSCTNTSNPSVMLAAGLLAKNAVERGLSVKPYVKTSLAPGSRVVTRYLEAAGLTPYLEQLGYYLVGFGCTTCLTGETPVLQANGMARRIEDLPEAGGASVFGPAPDGGIAISRQAALIKQGVRDVVALTLQDGRSITCTPAHQILRADGRWVRADALEPGKDRVTMGL